MRGKPEVQHHMLPRLHKHLSNCNILVCICQQWASAATVNSSSQVSTYSHNNIIHIPASCDYTSCTHIRVMWLYIIHIPASCDYTSCTHIRVMWLYIIHIPGSCDCTSYIYYHHFSWIVIFQHTLVCLKAMIMWKHKSAYSCNWSACN